TGKLILIGLNAEGRLAVFERTFNRAMGLWADGQTLWLSSLYQVWRFENVLVPGSFTRATIASTCRASATLPATSTSTISPSKRAAEWSSSTRVLAVWRRFTRATASRLSGSPRL